MTLKKRKTNQSTKINLIGCDTIVNSPSFMFNIVAGLIALLVVTAISCGMKNLCKRRDTQEGEESSSLGNSAMMSNGLNKEERCVLR